MSLFSTTRGRRLLFVVLVVVLLAFPLVSSLATMARVERSGTDVTAAVVETPRRGEAYLVGFRLPEDVDPERHVYSAEVDRGTYEEAVASKQVTVRVLEDRPEAHRVEGEIRNYTPYVVMGAGIAVVLVVGLWWVRVGRRRPAVRLRAVGPLEPADADEAESLDRIPDQDVYEVVGTLVSADDAEAVLDLGERRVVVVLDGYANPVDVGAIARARGPLIG